MKKVRVSSAAQVAAGVLREAILAHEGEATEWFLGSEDDVLKRLGISRPTLRQAARLVEAEGLLLVRRGIGGGIFGRRPSRDAVTHMATISLRSAGASYGDLIRTFAFLSSEVARLAAENPDAGARTRALELVQGWSKASPHDPSEAQRRAGAFHHVIADLAGSPALTLFVNVLTELAEPVARLSFENPEHVRQVSRGHVAVAQAIAAGDAQVASSRMRAHLLKTLHWIDDRVLLQLFQGDQLDSALLSAG
jgi:GntR family transcriptional regulator, transcriptional repressor for pyruvate dehydrogenase complex